MVTKAFPMQVQLPAACLVVLATVTMAFVLLLVAAADLDADLQSPGQSLLFIGVDAVQGDDESCTVTRLIHNTTATLSLLPLPCRTVRRAARRLQQAAEAQTDTTTADQLFLLLLSDGAPHAAVEIDILLPMLCIMPYSVSERVGSLPSLLFADTMDFTLPPSQLAIVDGTGGAFSFRVNQSCHLIIYGIRFQSSITHSIRSSSNPNPSGNWSFYHVEFINSGGSIARLGGRFLCTHCLLANLRLLNGSQASIASAVYAGYPSSFPLAPALLALIDCDFHLRHFTMLNCSNFADSGGVIYIHNGFPHEGTIEFSTFDGNSNFAHMTLANLLETSFGGAGGALWSDNGNIILNISDSTFTRNSAAIGGGLAMMLPEDYSPVDPGFLLFITRCRFDSNVASIMGAGVYFTLNHPVVLSGIECWHNQAGKAGSCIYVDSVSSVLFEHAYAENNECLTSDSSDNQGAVFMRVQLRTFSPSEVQGTFTAFHNCTLVRNRDRGLFAQSESQVVTSSIITDCLTPFRSGGAILLTFFEATPRSSSTSISDLTIERCSAVNEGGGLMIEGLHQVMIDRMTIRNCSAGMRGGGMSYQSFANLVITDIQMSTVTLENNRAPTGGGFFVTQATVYLFDVSLLHNRAIRGGGFYAAQGSICFVNGLIEGNIVEQMTPTDFVAGAAASTSGGTCTFVYTHVISNSIAQCMEEANPKNDTILLNPSSYSGANYFGTFHASATTVGIWSAVWRNNTACMGGAIFIAGESVVAASGTRFESNSAINGGVVAIDGQGEIRFRDNSYVENVAHQSGGVVHAVQAAWVEFTGSQFICNTARLGDGGVFWLINTPLITISESSLQRNTAPFGGGGVLFFAGGATLVSPSIPCDANECSQDNSTARYGPLQASSLARVSLVIGDTNPALASSADPLPTVNGYAGQPLQAISILAYDIYDQLILSERNLVIQLQLSAHFGVDPAYSDRISSKPPAVQGTLLVKVDPASGSAVFWDIALAGLPGLYSFEFNVVGFLSVPLVKLNVRIMDSCLADRYLDFRTSSCRSCADTQQVLNRQTRQCEDCAAGFEIVARPVTDMDGQSERITYSCVPCALGTSSSPGGTCAPCTVNSYTPLPTLACHSCQEAGMEGLHCVNGLAEIEPGYFAYQVTESTKSGALISLFRTVTCPMDNCPAAKLQLVSGTSSGTGNGNNSSSTPLSATNNVFVSQCQFPRLTSTDNWLCGQCVDGYMPFNGKCRPCDGQNGGLILLYLVFSFALVFFFLVSAGSSRTDTAGPSGELGIALYFLQTAALEFGPVSNIFQWMSVVNADPASSQSCIAPLSEYGQVVLSLMVPAILFGELVVIAVMHWCVRHVGCVRAEGSEAGQDSNPSSTMSRLWLRVTTAARRFVHDTSLNQYIAALLSILLFCYYQVATTCLHYLQCVTVAEFSVLYLQPTIDCRSDPYRAHLVAVALMLIVYTIGFPLFSLLLLIRHRKTIVSRAQESDAFTQRWGVLFQMYRGDTFFWGVIVLVRRILFVTLDSVLVGQARVKYMAFTIGHCFFLASNVFVQPFQTAFLNTSEILSHFLLIIVSAIFTAYREPYAVSIQVTVLLLIVLPTAGFIIGSAVRKWQQDRQVQRKREMPSPFGAVTEVRSDDERAEAVVHHSGEEGIEMADVPVSVDGHANDARS
jgi:hypothetical protein